MADSSTSAAAEGPSSQHEIEVNEDIAGDGGEPDENEIDLDEDDDDEQPTETNPETAQFLEADSTDEKPVASDGSDTQKGSSKSSALKDRLRLLKQKMNQARQLNRQAVQEEGQKVQSGDRRSGKTKAAKINPLTQQVASQVVHEARQASEKDALNQFAVNDYYNPQGQFRNYQRNLNSLPSARGQVASATTSTYDPAAASSSINNAAGEVAERDGARRLAQDMHRRIEKKQKRELKRKEKEMVEDEEDDVGYINQRNKHFNKKINRTYDEATSEIRQNLERGTAL